LSCEKAQQQHHKSNVNGNGSTAATSAQHSSNTATATATRSGSNSDARQPSEVACGVIRLQMLPLVLLPGCLKKMRST